MKEHVRVVKISKFNIKLEIHILLVILGTACTNKAQCYETLFVNHLRIFILSLSVCYKRLKRDKHFILKISKDGAKMFYNIGPRS
jgi:hypothetical protein